MSGGHTPGPWTAHNCAVKPTKGDDGERFWEVVSGSVHKSPSVNHVSGYIACPEMSLALVQFGPAEANAHLIAAAPDLYEVVERLNASGHAISQPLRWEMQAALAKARGETA